MTEPVTSKRCLVCASPIEPFHRFGPMPVANGFLLPEQFADEFFFELEVGFCSQCRMVQLTQLVDPQRLFHDHYAFFSSTSRRMAEHFQALAQYVRTRYLTGDDPFVVELGSNDGILLQHFARLNIRHLGLEPSKNVAQVAIEKGITTLTEFFDASLAQKIIAGHGQADVVIGANVMCHIPDLHSVAAGVKQLLKPRGVFMFEDPYLGDIVEKTSYDQIYDEHVFYFSVTSIERLFREHALELIDVHPLPVHGGSMRYVFAHPGAYQPTPIVQAQREQELRIQLDHIETYQRLSRNIERSRDTLMQLLNQLRTQGKRVVGYGATSKSTTVTNYCGITPELVEFITDTTPIKQGKFSPGTHIPVRPHDAFTKNYPDYALLFAWNHRDEIMAKESGFHDAGGRWISYVPHVEVLK